LCGACYRRGQYEGYTRRFKFVKTMGATLWGQTTLARLYRKRLQKSFSELEVPELNFYIYTWESR